MALDKLVSAQAQRAIEEADVVMFVVDVTVGPTAEDADVARLLVRAGPAGRPGRQQGRQPGPPGRHLGVHGPGLPAPWPVSALHGRGTGDLLDARGPAAPVPDSAGPRGAGRP